MFWPGRLPFLTAHFAPSSVEALSKLFGYARQKNQGFLRMAFANRIRSSLPLVSKILKSDSLSAANGSAAHRALLCPNFTDSEVQIFPNAETKMIQKLETVFVIFRAPIQFAYYLPFCFLNIGTLLVFHFHFTFCLWVGAKLFIGIGGVF